MTTEVKDIEKKGTQGVEKIERPKAHKVYKPRVDIVERENEVILFADMPGVDKKAVDITIEKDQLTLSGHVEKDYHKGYDLVHREYGIGDYERVFTLSNEIDREHIEASISHGVLKLVFPKAEKAKIRKISVKTA